MWALSYAPTWEIGAENRSVNMVNHYYYYHYHHHHRHYYCCCSWWWHLLLGLLVLRPSISSLLQSATAYFITKCYGLLLQSATILLQSAKGESATIITNCDRTPFFRLVAVMKIKFSTHKIYLWEHLIRFVCQHWWLKANITFSIPVLCLRKIQSLNFLSYEFTPSLQWVT